MSCWRKIKLHKWNKNINSLNFDCERMTNNFEKNKKTHYKITSQKVTIFATKSTTM